MKKSELIQIIKENLKEVIMEADAKANINRQINTLKQKLMKIDQEIDMHKDYEMSDGSGSHRNEIKKLRDQEKQIRQQINTLRTQLKNIK